ncbi:MAG: thiol reductant ABC exporter subunit CydD [Pontibacterium sp.]
MAAADAAPDTKKLKAAKSWLKQQHPAGQRLVKASMLVGALAALLMIAQASFLAKAAHLVIFEDHTLNDVLPWLGYFLVCLVLRSVANGLSHRLAHKGAKQVQHNLRSRLYQHLNGSNNTFIQSQASAKLSNTLIDGIDSLADYYAGYLPAVAYSGVIPIAVMFVVMPLDWQSGLILLVCAPVIPFFMIMIGMRAQALNQKRWQELTRLSQRFLDRIRGMAQLKLFNATTSELILVAQATDQFRRSTLAVLRVAFLSSLALEFLASISIAMVAVTIGFRLLWGELDFYTGFFILLLAPEFFLPLRQLGTQYHARMQGLSAAQDMMDIFEQTSDQADAEMPTQSQSKTSTKTAQSTGEHKALSLQIHKLSFSYDGQNKAALNNISLEFNGPGLYAIVGESGAGKSTLFDLLLGFLTPSQGQITLTQAGQSAPLTLENVSWVPQKPKLFASSVFQNIAPHLGLHTSSSFDSLAADTREQIQAAARAAYADEFIQPLAHGYATQLGEGGEGVSGGQKQRIATARAFYKNSPVLLLDEPSAHLDSDSEAALQKAVEAYAKDHIVIVIAHRLHTLTQAKQLFVLQSGQVAEQGDYEQLNQPGKVLYEQTQAANLLAQGGQHD